MARIIKLFLTNLESWLYGFSNFLNEVVTVYESSHCQDWLDPPTPSSPLWSGFWELSKKQTLPQIFNILEHLVSYKGSFCIVIHPECTECMYSIHCTLYTLFAILGEIPQRARKERDQSCNPIGQRKIKTLRCFCFWSAEILSISICQLEEMLRIILPFYFLWRVMDPRLAKWGLIRPSQEAHCNNSAQEWSS